MRRRVKCHSGCDCAFCFVRMCGATWPVRSIVCLYAFSEDFVQKSHMMHICMEWHEAVMWCLTVCPGL